MHDVIVDRVRLVACARAALLGFAVGGGMMFVTLTSLVWALTSSVGVANTSWARLHVSYSVG